MAEQPTNLYNKLQCTCWASKSNNIKDADKYPTFKLWSHKSHAKHPSLAPLAGKHTFRLQCIFACLICGFVDQCKTKTTESNFQCWVSSSARLQLLFPKFDYSQSLEARSRVPRIFTASNIFFSIKFQIKTIKIVGFHSLVLYTYLVRLIGE